MEEEQPSSSSSPLATVAKKPNSRLPVVQDSYLGKHRMAAAITRLEHQIQIIQKELQELDTMDPSSTSCKEVISSVENVPDALLPITRGPIDTSWDRWFRGTHNSRSHKRWI
ncbi:PREDICTED: guanine nucleotide-binding protein subunit gamma 2-like [Nelumbo nucifera]|nr:PREDICTED: guanine nucleotide-binding protein subunit gamma 2-like [Nelumbo nucifera]